MKLTTKGQYAIVAMTFIKSKVNEGDIKPVRLADISNKEGLSLNYLEQIFRDLRNANLVTSMRGPGGGYVLKAGAISYGKVLAAVGEKVELSANVGPLDGTGVSSVARSKLTGLQAKLMDSFNATMI